MVTRTKKIFVGGLSAPTTLEDVKNYFEQFGRVSWKSFNLNFEIIFNFDLHIIYIIYLPGTVKCSCKFANFASQNNRLVHSHWYRTVETLL